MLRREFLFRRSTQLCLLIKAWACRELHTWRKKVRLAAQLTQLHLECLSGAHGRFADAVQQLEIVLSNGDVIQTGRISRRELSKKKGLSTFEGEIYREIDNLISDNAELISQMDPALPDTVGYSGISRVKQKDGSFDLTPLFIGSQGSLGVICEVIMKAQFIRPEYSCCLTASYKSLSDAQSAVELAMKIRRQRWK